MERHRETPLFRGNRLQNGRIGVIVGGGGRAVHCNDGPRHHILNNQLRDLSTAAVSVSDYTTAVFVRSNEFADNSSHLLVTFGAHGVLFEQNRVGTAAVTPITIALDDSSDVTVRNNRFFDVCGPEDAFLVLGNAEAPVLSGNVWSDCAE